MTTDDGTGIVHTAIAFGEDDFQLGERYGLTLQNPVRPDGTFDERMGPFAGRWVKEADPDIVEALREKRPALPRDAVRARLPALLALRHAAPLLREGVLVREDDGGARPDARREREDHLVPRAHQARALRRLARGQRGLGAVARALLGHAAADVALRRGSRALRGIARGAGRAGGLRARGPAPAVHRRGRVPVCRVRRGDAAHARGDRRLVGLRLDAVRPVARAFRERACSAFPGRLHLRGARPDPRLVLLAARREHAHTRAVARTGPCSASA